MRILKFGGKSLETTQKTQKICKYIKKIYKKERKLIIVVSAMGSSTNSLIELSKPFKPEKHSKRELDALLSTGETISASLFAMILNSMSVPAKSFQAWQLNIKTHGDFQNSLITHIDKQKLDECLSLGVVAVVTGFQGVNSSGETTTLGRGGSDTTAAAIGAVYNTNVELYSDFNGMYSCDPRDIKTKKLKSISLEQLDKATSNGTKLVSNRAVKISKTHNINLILKSSSEPDLVGTISNSIETENIIISSISNLCEITIDLSNESKIKLLSKNVLLWLNGYKIYNFTLNSCKIILLVNTSDKNEILKILAKKLNIWNKKNIFFMACKN